MRLECGAAIDENLADTAGRWIAAYTGKAEGRAFCCSAISLLIPMRFNNRFDKTGRFYRMIKMLAYYG
jgi:hypothetical protein